MPSTPFSNFYNIILEYLLPDFAKSVSKLSTKKKNRLTGSNYVENLSFLAFFPPIFCALGKTKFEGRVFPLFGGDTVEKTFRIYTR